MKTYFATSLVIFLLYAFYPNNSIAQLEPFGLPGQTITALALLQDYPSAGGAYLFAATDTSGIFRKSTASPDSPWVYYGLAGKRIRSLFIYRWGVGPAQLFTIFAGAWPDKSKGDSVLIYQSPVGMSPNWTRADSGLDASVVPMVNSIDGFYTSGNSPPVRMFAASVSALHRSWNHPAPIFWQDIWPRQMITINIVHVFRERQFSESGEIWVGGETGLFAPFIAKSTDYGDNWEIFDLYNLSVGDNACYSIAVHPTHPDTVYAGMEGLVLKTTNGGKTWSITGLLSTPFYFYGLLLNPLNPEHVIAGGVANNPEKQFGLFQSFDGGTTWEKILPSDSLRGISQLVGEVSGSYFRVYIATFGDGVYRYLAGPTGISNPKNREVVKQIALYSNYPNPFNSSTTIRYEVLVTARVKIEVYNLLGQSVRTLVETFQSPGIHVVKWDGLDQEGKEVNSGVYVVRMRAFVGGKRTQDARKILFIK